MPRTEIERAVAALLNVQFLTLDRGRLRIVIPMLAIALASRVDDLMTVLLHGAVANELLTDRSAGRTVPPEDLARHLGWCSLPVEHSNADLVAIVEEVLSASPPEAFVLVERILPQLGDGTDRAAALTLRARALLASGAPDKAHTDAALAARLGAAQGLDVAAATLVYRRDISGLADLGAQCAPSSLPRAWAALELAMDERVTEADALAADDPLATAWRSFARGSGEDARASVERASWSARWQLAPPSPGQQQRPFCAP